MNSETQEKLKQIFLIVLDQPDGTDVGQLRQIGCSKWDSLATVSLVTAVESEFGVDLTTTQRERFTSYQSVALLIDELLT